MSAHHIDQREIKRALAEYVIRRDGLSPVVAHMVELEMHCEVYQAGEPGPLFTIHLKPVAALSAGGEG